MPYLQGQSLEHTGIEYNLIGINIRNMQEFLSAAGYVLGETGQTVVYVFPNGQALPSREAQSVADATSRFSPTDLSPTSTSPGGEAWIDRLLEQGMLTPAQLEVSRYDQQTTGLALVDTLLARGWLSSDQIQDIEGIPRPRSWG